MNRLLIRVSIALLPIMLFAHGAMGYEPQGHSMGHAAHNLLGPLGAIISMVRAICIITGLGLLLGSMVKYSDHRNNRQQTTLTTIFVMIVAGAALMTLAFIPLMNVKVD